MKKGWKIFWIVCGILLAVGFICCIAATALGVTSDMIEGRVPNGISLGFWDDDDEYSGTVIEGSDRQTFTGVRGIEADISAGEIEIISTSEGENGIIVQTENISEHLKLRCYMDGDELKIETRKKIAGINNGSVGKVQIFIPQDYMLEEVSFDVGAGKLYIEDVLTQYLQVSVGAGEANIDHFAAQEAELECGAGSITAVGLAAQEADIECGVGEITYTTAGEETDYNYEVSCGIGEVICGSNRFSGLGREKSINNSAAKDMNIDCGIGNIKINFSGEL